MAGRGISADVVSRLSRQGLVAIRNERVDRDPVRGGRVRRRGPAGRAPPQWGAGDCRGAADGAGARGVVPGGAAARRDRQRQDRDLSAAVGDGPRCRPAGVDAGAGDCPSPPAVAALFRQTFGDRVAIQHSGPVGRRAPRSVAADPSRRGRRGSRHPLGSVRAGGKARADHRRRGARRIVQAGGEARATTGATWRLSAASAPARW